MAGEEYIYVEQSDAVQADVDLYDQTQAKGGDISGDIVVTGNIEGNIDVSNVHGLADVAISGSYEDLTSKPGAFTGATASTEGTQGFVPAPEAGDQNKVLQGDGTWGTVAAASHTHGNITNDGKVGTASGKPLVTGTGGAVQAGSFGTTAGTVCEGNDSRLSNARTPTSHTHGASDISSGTIDAARLPISSGAGWLRLPGNIQICWGTETISGNPDRVSYAKSFASTPALTVTAWTNAHFAQVYTCGSEKFSCRIVDRSGSVVTSGFTVFYIAIGTYTS